MILHPIGQPIDISCCEWRSSVNCKDQLEGYVLIAPYRVLWLERATSEITFASPIRTLTPLAGVGESAEHIIMPSRFSRYAHFITCSNHSWEPINALATWFRECSRLRPSANKHYKHTIRF